MHQTKCKPSKALHLFSYYHLSYYINKCQNLDLMKGNDLTQTSPFLLGRYEYEHVFIEKIVEQVSRKTIPVTLYVPDNLVGL